MLFYVQSWIFKLKQPFLVFRMSVKLVATKEIAEACGVEHYQLLRAIKQGFVFPDFTLPGAKKIRQYLFDEANIEKIKFGLMRAGYLKVK